MDQCHAVEAVILIDHIHSAPVSEPVYGEFRDGHQVSVVIQ